MLPQAKIKISKTMSKPRGFMDKLLYTPVYFCKNVRNQAETIVNELSLLTQSES